MTTFHVLGLPITQGSKIVYRGHLVDVKSKELKAWRNKIAEIASSLFDSPHEQAVTMELCFFLPKPKTVKRRLPFVKPDVDKLGRAVMDSLTGVAYKDDSQVTDLILRKRYGQINEIGVLVVLMEMK